MTTVPFSVDHGSANRLAAIYDVPAECSNAGHARYLLVFAMQPLAIS